METKREINKLNIPTDSRDRRQRDRKAGRHVGVGRKGEGRQTG